MLGMKASDQQDPRWVDAILETPLVWFVARAFLVSAYLIGGLAKLTDWPGAVAEQVHFGLHPAALWAGVTITVEIVAPVLILAGRFVWLGAGALSVFTVLAACIANAFWAMPSGPARFAATNAFFEHLGLVGGFMLVALAAERAPRERRS